MRSNKGFTLLELLITLALIGIIAGLAVPSFAQVLANNRITSVTNNLIGVLNYARAESVKRGRAVDVTALASAGNGDEWGGGWRVWVDSGAADYQPGEEIRIFNQVPDSVTINGTDGVTNFRFRANGFVDPSPAAGAEYSFQVCDDRTGETGRIIRIHTSGRVRHETVTCG
ncbi:GspH/FimT family pseudopilin [Marinobacter arenosus]|uniref:GspH/FimT family pseudopilin n=1 Tax=Marinobacter arenosus TaxID=2856822 RepID=UPI001C4B1F48|nr:GspH/FimT family pseudopilin [Marinobacter arenosus]MBW0149430.1 GspH/FimT family pseudopilin [Marinobacter arenosus]